MRRVGGRASSCGKDGTFSNEDSEEFMFVTFPRDSKELMIVTFSEDSREFTVVTLPGESKEFISEKLNC